MSLAKKDESHTMIKNAGYFIGKKKFFGKVKKLTIFQNEIFFIRQTKLSKVQIHHLISIEKI